MYSWKDRLIDWANQRGAWTHILVAAGIALIITAIILAAAMPSKGDVDTNAVDIGDLQGDFVTIVGSLGTKASQADLDELEADVGDQKNDIAIIRGSLAGLSNSPPEAYLTGTFGSYTLHAKSSEAGDFTANVHLVYSAPVSVGNTTTYNETVSAFYASINFTEPTQTYIPVVAFNGTAWGISEVWFNIGTFELMANTEKLIDITYAGLNSTWVPSYAYVEVWSVL